MTILKQILFYLLIFFRKFSYFKHEPIVSKITIATRYAANDRRSASF